MLAGSRRGLHLVFRAMGAARWPHSSSGGSNRTHAGLLRTPRTRGVSADTSSVRRSQSCDSMAAPRRRSKRSSTRRNRRACDPRRSTTSGPSSRGPSPRRSGLDAGQAPTPSRSSASGTCPRPRWAITCASRRFRASSLSCTHAGGLSSQQPSIRAYERASSLRSGGRTSTSRPGSWSSGAAGTARPRRAVTPTRCPSPRRSCPGCRKPWSSPPPSSSFPTSAAGAAPRRAAPAPAACFLEKSRSRPFFAGPLAERGSCADGSTCAVGGAVGTRSLLPTPRCGAAPSAACGCGPSRSSDPSASTISVTRRRLSFSARRCLSSSCRRCSDIETRS